VLGYARAGAAQLGGEGVCGEGDEDAVALVVGCGAVLRGEVRVGQLVDVDARVYGAVVGGPDGADEEVASALWIDEALQQAGLGALAGWHGKKIVEPRRREILGDGLVVTWEGQGG
jgi:hypothetical protein